MEPGMKRHTTTGDATHLSMVHSEQTHISTPMEHQLGLKIITKDMKLLPRHITQPNFTANHHITTKV